MKNADKQKHIKNVDMKKASDIRLAFFDIDGTVLRSDLTLSSALISKIHSLQKKGIHTCLATGRPLFSARSVAEQLNITGISMFFSGGLVGDLNNGQVLLKEALPSEETSEFCRMAESNNLFTEAYSVKEYFVKCESELSKIHKQYLKQEPILANIPDLVTQREIIKLVLATENDEQFTRMQTLMQAFPDFNYGIGHGAAHPNIKFINVTSPRASRETAFNCIIKHFSVEAEQVVAFGDAIADIPFFKLSGIGIAVGNANQETKDAADYVTTAVDEDGVVLALNALGL